MGRTGRPPEARGLSHLLRPAEAWPALRIAVVNWSSRMAGGAETYLRQIIPELRKQGHQVAFVHESEEPPGREPISQIDPELVWSIAQSGSSHVLSQLAAWNPALLFVHGLRQFDWLAEAVKTIPSAFFCHDYAGICISGTKTFRTFSRACERPFGPGCLAHYYPFHCGGWSPLTMLQEYARQSDRLALLRQATGLVTASGSVRQQYLRNGFAPERVHLAPLMPSVSSCEEPAVCPPPGAPWKLLFASRMEWMKGGDVLLDALPAVYTTLQQPLHVIFSGDGHSRSLWEQRAVQLRQQFGPQQLRIEFIGWQPAGEVQAILRGVHLLVLPSVWPEPFGLVGVEAGCHGVPVAAFNTGGIPDWLSEGVNGFMAAANPPSATGLANAIIRCLQDANTYQQLRSGASQVARQFSLERHLTRLQEIFLSIVQQAPVSPS